MTDKSKEKQTEMIIDDVKVEDPNKKETEDNSNNNTVTKKENTVSEGYASKEENKESKQDDLGEEIRTNEPVDKKSTEVDEKGIEKEKQKVTTEYSHKASQKMKIGEEVDLPSDFVKKVTISLNNLPNIEIITENNEEWIEVIKNGLLLNTFNEAFVESLQDKKADFKQNISHGGSDIRSQLLKLKQKDNEVLSGESGVIRLVKHLGIGSLFQVPLYSSGLWITFKPPTESEMIEFRRILNSDKITFGRYSYGLSFSNTSSYTTGRIVNLALSHVYSVTSITEEISLEELDKYISSQDINMLIWGFMCSMYPNGFKYRRSCTSDADKCNHIESDTLNLTKLDYYNIGHLSEWQKHFMTKRKPNSQSLEEIKRYKEELKTSRKSKIIIYKGTDKEIRITLKSPTISEFIESGYTWINNITEAVNTALGSDDKIEERNTLIKNHGQATSMRQYLHWVDSVEFGTNVVSDIGTLKDVFDRLSGEDEVKEKFITGVINYINHTTIALVGIPTYDCPKCNMVQKTNPDISDEFKDILPLDLMQLFLVLLTQRMESLLNR